MQKLKEWGPLLVVLGSVLACIFGTFTVLNSSIDRMNTSVMQMSNDLKALSGRIDDLNQRVANMEGRLIHSDKMGNRLTQVEIRLGVVEGLMQSTSNGEKRPPD